MTVTRAVSTIYASSKSFLKLYQRIIRLHQFHRHRNIVIPQYLSLFYLKFGNQV
jgi:hypothetical protein